MNSIRAQVKDRRSVEPVYNVPYLHTTPRFARSPVALRQPQGVPVKLTLTSLVRARVARILVAFVALALTVAAVPSGRPEDVGLSTERLQRINQVVQRYIDAKEIAGAVTVVSRRGRVAHFEAQGLMDIERNAPMRKDGIFRMASMTKPVIGVAIMIMLEEGRIRLSDPVSTFIPEFKNAKVAIEM